MRIRLSAEWMWQCIATWQVEQIKLAIGAAGSLDEVQALERALKNGNYDVIAKAAAAAKAASGAVVEGGDAAGEGAATS